MAKPGSNKKKAAADEVAGLEAFDHRLDGAVPEVLVDFGVDAFVAEDRQLALVPGYVDEDSVALLCGGQLQLIELLDRLLHGPQPLPAPHHQDNRNLGIKPQLLTHRCFIQLFGEIITDRNAERPDLLPGYALLDESFLSILRRDNIIIHAFIDPVRMRRIIRQGPDQVEFKPFRNLEISVHAEWESL